MTVAVEIAGVGLRFGSDHPGAAPLLRQRFAGFLADPSEAVDIHLELSGDHPATAAIGTPLTLTERNDRSLELTGDGTHARVTPDNGHATLAAPLAAHPIDALVRLLLARALLARGALLVHASAVVTRERALVFVGATGSGKTTVATTLTGDILADEAIALAPEGETIIAHGTPYWRGAARTAQLDRLVFLARARATHWAPMPRSRTAAKLFAAAGPLPASATAAALDAATEIASRDPMAAEATMARRADILEWLAPRLASHG